ncbi:MAG: HDOD domain-containing protein [candidate division Zixibacteria bacterium]
MNELKYIDKIQRDDSLLSMPQSLSQMLTLVGSDDYSIEDLIKVVMNDPGLTSRILKMANSSFYGHRSEISTLHQAVMMLGATQIKCLVLSASVFQVQKLESDYNLDIKGMFTHFIGVALVSKNLADFLGHNQSEELFIAGLLHDIGQLFFIRHFPQDYMQVEERLSEFPSRFEAEQKILGIDHAAIGQMLAEKWGFPAILKDTIGGHHNSAPNIAENQTMQIIQLADLLHPYSSDDTPIKIEKRMASIGQLINLLNINHNDIETVTRNLPNEIITIADSFGIDIGDPSELLARANRELFNSFITIEHLFRERQDLSQRILIEERRAAVMETKNVAIATLSHYINNAAMAISGRAQLLKMLRDRERIIDKDDRLDNILEVVEKSLKKIMAVILELRDLTNLEEIEKYSESNAICIDDRVQSRLKELENSGEVLLPVQEAQPDK